MLERIDLDWVGGIHVVFGLLAIGLGAAVLLVSKGTSLHLRLGRLYAWSMFGLNGTAFLIYELFGGFGPFHATAVVNLATLIAGLWALRNRTPGWVQRHAIFMCWSYVGLLAATAAEIASRIPGWDFGPSVVGSSLVTVLIGGVWIHTRIGSVLRGYPHLA